MVVSSSSREYAMIFGKGPNLAITLDERFDFGSDRQLASFDMLYKSHYLNEPRKTTFEVYGQHGPVTCKVLVRSSPTLRKHVNVGSIMLCRCLGDQSYLGLHSTSLVT